MLALHSCREPGGPALSALGLLLPGLLLLGPGATPAEAAGSAPSCRGQVATILGTPEDDVITGTPSDDVISARSGIDHIDGRGGHDVICAGRGADLLEGGPGDDWLGGRRGADLMRGGAGSDVLRGDDYRSLRRPDHLQGGVGDDLLVAGGPDVLDFEDAAQAVDVDLAEGRASGQGDDVIVLGVHDAVRVIGSPHDDTLSGGAGQSALVGGDGDDVLTAGAAATRLEPGPGANVTNGGQAGDRVVVLGDDGPDVVYAGAGDDQVEAVSGLGPHDRLYGENGYDYFSVATDLTGHQVVDGGGGETGPDRNYLGLNVYAASGQAQSHDVVTVDADAGSVVAGDLSLLIPGIRNVNIVNDWKGDHVASYVMLGSPDSDLFRTQSTVAVTMRGLGGEDWLVGGPADDLVEGGSGVDHGSAGAGVDVCTSLEESWSQHDQPKSCETDTP